MAGSFIVRLGPVDGEGGTVFSYSVLAGHLQESSRLAATDDEAFEAIVFDHGREDLVCEPLLADAAQRFGLPVQPLTRLASLGLALRAFDFCHGQPLARITEPGLVHQFCTIIADFDAAIARLPDFVFRPLRLRVGGTVQFVTDLSVRAGVPDGEFLSITMERAERPETSSRIRVSRHVRPAFIRDALGRSHRLGCIPVPSRIVRGAEQQVEDLQLAIIISTLNAILHLRQPGDIGRSQFRIRDFDVDCDVGIDVG
jgi:hypothetical protein